jgi:hypothetical protein
MDPLQYYTKTAVLHRGPGCGREHRSRLSVLGQRLWRAVYTRICVEVFDHATCRRIVQWNWAVPIARTIWLAVEKKIHSWKFPNVCIVPKEYLLIGNLYLLNCTEGGWNSDRWIIILEWIQRELFPPYFNCCCYWLFKIYLFIHFIQTINSNL